MICFKKYKSIRSAITLFCLAFVVLIATMPTVAAADDRIDPGVVSDYLAIAKDENQKIDTRIDAIRYLPLFKFKEVVDGLLEILHAEVEKDPLAININLLTFTIESLGKCATAEELEIFEAILGDTVETVYLNNAIIENSVYSAKQAEHLYKTLLTAREKIKYNSESLEHLPKISNRSSSDAKDLTLSEQLEKFAFILHQEIKGQPHVIKKLLKLRARDLFYGIRENPAFWWFMGPPGTGKDTSVRAYLRAVNNNDPLAHRDHMFRVDPLRQEGDLWSFLGSSTGYVGSDGLAPVLKFLVNHAGGRYQLIEVPGEYGRPPTYKILENKKWKPGEVLPGYTSPDRGLVYFDEFHDWSESLKNTIVKKAVEYNGYWKINNPNGGLSEIYVPITVVAASNDGIELVTSREKNGQRFGKPQTYEQMMQKADRVRNDPVALRNSILSSNQSKAIPHAKGTSEELLNRVPDDHLIYFDPISPKQLKEIAESKLLNLRVDFANSKSGFNNIKLSWTQNVIDFIQEYHYVAEDQARPIEARLRSLVEATIIDAAAKDLIKPNTPVDLKIDVIKQADNTWHMRFVINNIENKTFELPILQTESDRFNQPISDERIDELAKIGPALEAGIVGQRHITPKIAKAIMLSQEGRDGMVSEAEATEAARLFMFLGPTSTGKTEMGKVIAEILHKDRSALVTLQFTGIQTAEQMRTYIYGYKSPSGDVTPSDFMKHYDRNSGRMVLAFDEIANAPEEALNVLFDIFREPTVTLFADGRPRVMSNVIIFLMGNASQEILRQLPTDLPEDIMRETWAYIYDQLEVDPTFRRKILEKYFSPPFIARIGDERIFFSKPLSHADVRVLTQMKLEKLFDELEATPEKRGWPIRFANRASYIKALSALEHNGFKVQEQGASTHNYIFEVFGKALRAELLTNKVSNKEAVTIYLDKVVVAGQNSPSERQQLVFGLQTESGRNLKFKIDGKPVSTGPKIQKSDQLLTAGHEAGHAIVASALLSDFSVSRSIKILPGLAEIAGEWVYYDGLATSDQVVNPKTTLDYVVRQAAILLGGTAAENLIVNGGMNSAGRSNDIQRATALFKTAILKWGMSKTFGKITYDIEKLSDKERERLNKEIRALTARAELMAIKAIVANRLAFTELTNQLAHKGELNAKEIKNILSSKGLIQEQDDVVYNREYKNNLAFFNNKNYSNRPGLRYEFVDSLGLVNERDVADLNKIVSNKIKKQLNSVKLPDNLSIVGRQERSKKSMCSQIMSAQL